MEKIFRTIEELWLTRIGGKTIMNNLGPMNLPPSDNELWNQIYNQARLDDMAGLFATAERKAANDPDTAARIRHMKKIHFDNLLVSYKDYKKRSESISSSQEELSSSYPATVWLQPLKYTDKPY